MTGVELIARYFPDLTREQRIRFERLGEAYAEWNARVNLISRKDFEHLYERHVLHSLGIARVHAFASGSRIIDVGTGGGFPGVPLAILFPLSTFHMIDGIGKKIMAVKGVIDALDLMNATAEQVRSEDHRRRYDHVVSRAVTTLPEFITATRHLLAPSSGARSASRVVGGTILYLKGGELADEIMPVKEQVRVFDLSEHFTEEFFVTKKVVRVQM